MYSLNARFKYTSLCIDPIIFIYMYWISGYTYIQVTVSETRRKEL